MMMKFLEFIDFIGTAKAAETQNAQTQCALMASSQAHTFAQTQI